MQLIEACRIFFSIFSLCASSSIYFLEIFSKSKLRHNFLVFFPTIHSTVKAFSPKFIVALIKDV